MFEEDYTIGQDPRWIALHLNGKERNLTAFNNELLASIAKEEDFHVRMISSLDLMDELQEGKLQGILTIEQPYHLNNSLLASDPYFLIGPVLIVPSQARQEERRMHVIGIPEQSPLLASLEQDPSIQVKIYDNILDALADLVKKQIDGAIFPAIPAYIYTQAFYKRELKIATLPLTDEGIRLIALNNETGQSLIEGFNQGLKKLKERGQYQEMLQHWRLMDVEQGPTTKEIKDMTDIKGTQE